METLPSAVRRCGRWMRPVLVGALGFAWITIGTGDAVAQLRQAPRLAPAPGGQTGTSDSPVKGGRVSGSRPQGTLVETLQVDGTGALVSSAAFAMLVGIRVLMGPTFGGFLILTVFWVPWSAVLDLVAARVKVKARAAAATPTSDISPML